MGAATINNAIQEHRDYAAQLGFSPPPMGLRIILGGRQKKAGAGSTPLFGIRTDFQQISDAFSHAFLYGGDINLPGGYTTALLTLSAVHVDMTLNYATPAGFAFTDDRVKATVYHELSHASHYAYAGKALYSTFVNNELTEISQHPNDSYTPYGIGVSAGSGLIALGEAWANHMGFYLCNKKYNVDPGAIKGDGNIFVQSYQTLIGTDLVALENFDPTLVQDPFKWIPIGLMLDLMDAGIDPINVNHVNDAVSGYTISQIFNALQSDVSSIAQYKARILQLYGTTQQTQINSLFTSYGY